MAKVSSFTGRGGNVLKIGRPSPRVTNEHREGYGNRVMPKRQQVLSDEIPLDRVEQLATLLADLLVKEVQTGAVFTEAPRRGDAHNGAKPFKTQEKDHAQSETAGTEAPRGSPDNDAKGPPRRDTYAPRSSKGERSPTG
jgi:hypothetical protein